MHGLFLSDNNNFMPVKLKLSHGIWCTNCPGDIQFSIRAVKAFRSP